MKNSFYFLSTLIITAAIIIVIYFLPTHKTKALSSQPRLEVIAHRGFEDMFPENTIYAAQHAVSLGAGPEFDVQFTADGEMIVIHDVSVDRTTNGTGLVNNLNYSYIEKLDAGSKFSKAFTGSKVPKFTDYLHAVENSKSIYPELKSYRNVYDIMKFTQTLLDNGFEDKATILSFNYKETLPIIRLKSNHIMVGALCKDIKSLNTSLRIARRDGHSMLFISTNLATTDTLIKCRSNNLDVVVWTIHDVDMLKKLRTIGYSRFICSKYMKIE